MLSKFLNGFARSWPLPALLAALLLLHIAHTDGWTDTILNTALLFYTIGLAWKSILRIRTLRPAMTKGLAVLLSLCAVILFVCAISTLADAPILTRTAMHFMLAFVLLIDLSEQAFLRFHLQMHPALTFVSTFAGIIFIGAALLMLPDATRNGISPVDALFTATSAVCVTGLTVLDTSKDFTLIGQWIILLLIQAGGLGILTFTNLFGILFRGEKSFRDLVFLTDLVSADNLRSTFGHLGKIIGFVFAIELLGMLLLYACRPESGWYFALFHSVSAFCNAGFSTLSNNLYESEIRYDYAFHLVIALLIIVGGIGYNVFFNVFSVYRYRAHRVIYRYTNWIGRPPKALVKWDINTTLVLRTTLLLLLLGWLGYFAFEYRHSLATHGALGKVIEAFFGAVTPRTAGFNTVDLTSMANPTIMLYLLLMWIGGSPGSTAGGIKTTVFAIAALNLFNQIRNRDRLVVRWQSIAPVIIARTATIISLSLFALGLSVALMISIQPELDVLRVAFECFSAYGTVGLTLSLTPLLCTANKLIIITLMFLGRVSFLTFLIAILAVFKPKKDNTDLIYPEKNIFLN
jgi:potassium uptake TrkH family protein